MNRDVTEDHYLPIVKEWTKHFFCTGDLSVKFIIVIDHHNLLCILSPLTVSSSSSSFCSLPSSVQRCPQIKFWNRMSTCNQSEQYEQHLWSRKLKFQNREMPRIAKIIQGLEAFITVHYCTVSFGIVQSIAVVCSRVSGRSCYGTFVCPAGCFEAVSADAQRRNVRRCGIWHDEMHDVGVIVVLCCSVIAGIRQY